MIKSGAAITGGVATAFGASLCCTAPLLAVYAGVGGAGLAAAFEPLRPFLLAASALLFLAGGVALYRPPPQRERGDATAWASASSTADACRLKARRRTRIFFWVALGLAALLASFPSWSKLLV